MINFKINSDLIIVDDAYHLNSGKNRDWDSLPKEIAMFILSKLSFQERIPASLVSKRWNQIVNSIKMTSPKLDSDSLLDGLINRNQKKMSNMQTMIMRRNKIMKLREAKPDLFELMDQLDERTKNRENQSQ